MEYRVTQTFDASMDAVVEAYRREATWQRFRDLPFVGDAIVSEFVVGEPTYVETRYKVSVNVSPAARRFIDPARLTFREISRLASDGTGTFEILPDHYGDLIRSSGTTRVVVGDDATCTRIVQGEVDVTLGWAGVLFERPVEDAIVRGLRDALTAQAERVLPV